MGSATTVSLPFPIGNSIVTILCNIAVGVFEIALAASVIAILVGGFFYLTAGGSEQRAAKGKQALTYAVYGIVVVILAWGAAFIVAELLGGVNATLSGCSSGGGGGGGGGGAVVL
jgi:hypothetical protein